MWPNGIRKRKPYKSDELVARDCDRDAEKIVRARGSGSIIELSAEDPNMLIGRVTPPGGGQIDNWFYHRVVLDGGRYYDLMTGPSGMTEAQYSRLFAQWEWLRKRLV
jgi:hypothetical protein